ncbi:hypothetical protein GCM10022253_30840 [Sphingomonas endophytica]|uniref:Uncharacterized protein n=1 Tax=Sphingomonas endophytica TaxID=869719 RepID=A0ABR6N919_9SPHN|nr:hypothetical protein [Sphingomonas endophytica]MBB5726551.1 hypothetical protein [Sphingomonas endophytica]
MPRFGCRSRRNPDPPNTPRERRTIQDIDARLYSPSLAQRRGVRVRRIALPEPATRAGLIGAYAQAMADEPRLKLILLTM